MKGKISKYLSFRGYGFISVKDQEKGIFFHMSKYPATEIPSKGQWVEFTVEETPKGKEAVDIKVIHDGADIAEETVETSSAIEAGKTPVELAYTNANDLSELNGVGPKYRELLEKVNVMSRKEMSGYTPEVLLENILLLNNKEQITKRPPTLGQVKEWISLATQ